MRRQSIATTIARNEPSSRGFSDLRRAELHSRQQVDGLDPEPSSNPLDRPERQVPFTPLDRTHVGSVDPQDLGEVLLAQPAGLSICPQILPEGALELPFCHATTLTGLLLLGLQTYE